MNETTSTPWGNSEIVRKHDNVLVHSVASVEGNWGPQWELGLQWSFSKFQTRGWVNNDGSTSMPVAGQTYPCLLERGQLSQRQSGPPYDGSADFMWRWKIIEFNTDQDAPAPTQQLEGQASPRQTGGHQAATPNPLSNSDPHQHSIERQVVFKAAVDIWAGWLQHTPYNKADPASFAAADEAAVIEDIAATLWPVLQNIGQDAPAGPESDATPAPAAEPRSGPQGPAGHEAEGPVDPNQGEEEPNRAEMWI